jgi:hypothetical protein
VQQPTFLKIEMRGVPNACPTHGRHVESNGNSSLPSPFGEAVDGSDEKQTNEPIHLIYSYRGVHC